MLCLVWTCSDAVRQWNSEAGTADRAGREYIYIYIHSVVEGYLFPLTPQARGPDIYLKPRLLWHPHRVRVEGTLHIYEDSDSVITCLDEHCTFLR